ncbi:MAG: hypothetical protein DWI48_04525 [Chloroflexi bacterium]|nr:MAG: hypothetical protein DWI48_04525 [Chloroflexota bacterium]
MSRPLRDVREDVHIHASYAEVRALVMAPQQWHPASFDDVMGGDEDIAFRLLLPMRSEVAMLHRNQSADVTMLEYSGDEASSVRALNWAINAEAPHEVHLLAELIYEPAGGPFGWALEEVMHRPARRQALRDALWRLKLLAEGRD